MLFTIDAEPLAKGEFTSSRDRETDYKMQSVLNAEDLTNEEYEELSKLKKQGKTTTEENARCERYYYKRFLALDELTEQDLKAFMYGENPLNNYLSLTYIKKPQGRQSEECKVHIAVTDRSEAYQFTRL